MTEDSQPISRRRWKKAVLYCAGISIAILLALELFCRFYLGLGDPPLMAADPQVEYLYKPSSEYHRFGNRVAFNSYSMRSDEFPPQKSSDEELRVLILGDSVVNGGALADQSTIVSEFLKSKLAADVERPVVVGNISAGSWGPGNLRGYVEKFGWFDADIAVIVVSSHDARDNPTFKPYVGVSAEAPGSAPFSALGEAIYRYLPRYLPSSNGNRPIGGEPDHEEFDPTQAVADLTAVVESAKQANVRLILAQHAEKSELSGGYQLGHEIWKNWAAEHGLPNVQLGDAFAGALREGRECYIDNIHPNRDGREIIAAAILPAILRTLNPSDTSTAAEGN